jgi:hypothetical protein
LNGRFREIGGTGNPSPTASMMFSIIDGKYAGRVRKNMDGAM